jgi:hypothetical protein
LVENMRLSPEAAKPRQLSDATVATMLGLPARSVLNDPIHRRLHTSRYNSDSAPFSLIFCIAL